MIRPIDERPSRFLTRKPEALTLGHCYYLAVGLADLIPNWSVELHHDEHGKAAIVIMPDDLDDTIFPTLILRSDESAFRLEELIGDAYRELGDHQVWLDVLCAIRIRLIWANSPETTLH